MEPETHQSNTWVTVDRFRDLSSAIVARSALEAAEIHCFLRDENTVRLDWQISNFIGGMRLQVLEEDRTAALEVLRGLAIADVPESTVDLAFLGETCPHCCSANVRRERRHQGLALAVLYFFGLPVSRGKLQWKCDACGWQWDDVPDRT